MSPAVIISPVAKGISEIEVLSHTGLVTCGVRYILIGREEIRSTIKDLSYTLEATGLIEWQNDQMKMELIFHWEAIHWSLSQRVESVINIWQEWFSSLLFLITLLQNFNFPSLECWNLQFWWFLLSWEKYFHVGIQHLFYWVKSWNWPFERRMEYPTGWHGWFQLPKEIV